MAIRTCEIDFNTPVLTRKCLLTPESIVIMLVMQMAVEIVHNGFRTIKESHHGGLLEMVGSKRELAGEGTFYFNRRYYSNGSSDNITIREYLVSNGWTIQPQDELDY